MAARSIRDFDVNPEKILALVPEGVSLDVLRDRGVVPLSLEGGVMTVAVSDYASTPDAQLLAAALGARVETALLPPAEVQSLIRSLYDIKSGVGQETLNAIEEVDDLSELARQEVSSTAY